MITVKSRTGGFKILPEDSPKGCILVPVSKEGLQPLEGTESWRPFLQKFAEEQIFRQTPKDADSEESAGLHYLYPAAESAAPIPFLLVPIEAEIASKRKQTGSETAALLQLGGQIARELKKRKVRQLHTPACLPLGPLELLLEGIWFGLYQFQDFQNKPEPEDIAITVYSDGSGSRELEPFAAAFALRIQTIENGLRLAKTPSNICTPDFFSRFAAGKLERVDNVTVDLWDESRLAAEKMNLILAVGQGSPKGSQLLLLDYRGAPENPDHMALVGKGVCFDTGGSNLKSSGNMLGMQYDMVGAAVVYSTFQWIAASRARLNLKAYIPLVENQIGGEALKPGDIITSALGKTVEINNTDAEGRLILADALYLAAKAAPRILIDCATLTGAAVVALGKLCAAFYSNDDETARRFDEAARATGEDVWRMPLFRMYAQDLKGEVGDLSNISKKGGEGGSILAALFLETFALSRSAEQPWIHLDLAGWGMNKEHPSFGKNGQVMGVRLLSEFLGRFAAVPGGSV